MNEFIIKKCLDLLPNDVENINVSYKNLNYLPDLSRFKKLKVLYCSGNKLSSLPILPENLIELYCSCNKLTSLPVLPEKLMVIHCNYNQLTSLPVLPEKLKESYCSCNKLTSLPVLNENLELLYCYNNNLTSLPVLPENLKELYYHSNPIYDILYDSNFNTINNKIKIWNNFRHLYYCLKYRKGFLKMMEPIIKKRYHPSYLDDLEEEDDLDEKLGEW